jgi:hypothetical protein
MAPTPENQGWRSLAALASNEMDEEKLLILVRELCNAFDDCHKPPQAEYGRNESASLKREG